VEGRLEEGSFWMGGNSAVPRDMWGVCAEQCGGEGWEGTALQTLEQLCCLDTNINITDMCEMNAFRKRPDGWLWNGLGANAASVATASGQARWASL